MAMSKACHSLAGVFSDLSLKWKCSVKDLMITTDVRHNFHNILIVKVIKTYIMLETFPFSFRSNLQFVSSEWQTQVLLLFCKSKTLIEFMLRKPCFHSYLRQGRAAQAGERAVADVWLKVLLPRDRVVWVKPGRHAITIKPWPTR